MEIQKIHPDIGKFIESLDILTNSKLVKAIELLSVREYHLSMPYSKKIENHLYELRVKNIQNIRVFYTFHQNAIILLHIIAKKSSKLLQKDLETARRRLNWLQ